MTLKDCEVQTFRVGGNGGQKVNKTSSGVRIIHTPSGARGESREYREQGRNKREAFVKMANSPLFTYWAAQETKRLTHEITDLEWVEDQMAEENIVVEYYTP